MQFTRKWVGLEPMQPGDIIFPNRLAPQGLRQEEHK